MGSALLVVALPLRGNGFASYVIDPSTADNWFSSHGIDPSTADNWFSSYIIDPQRESLWKSEFTQPGVEPRVSLCRFKYYRFPDLGELSRAKLVTEGANHPSAMKFRSPQVMYMIASQL